VDGLQGRADVTDRPDDSTETSPMGQAPALAGFGGSAAGGATALLDAATGTARRGGGQRGGGGPTPAPEDGGPVLRSTTRSWWRRWSRSASLVVVLVVAVAIWDVLAVSHVFPAVALPSPGNVWDAFVRTATKGYLGKTLGQDVAYSVVRVAIGFIGAVVLGVPIGLLMAESTIVHRIIDPFLQLGRPVPPLAYIPLFVVWFGLGELPKVLLILVGTIPIIIISTIGGVRSVPRQRIEVARCLGASRAQIFVRVILPSTLPEIFTGMRVGIGIAWSTLVAAELIAASVGLGWLVEQAATQLQTGIVIGGIIVIGILGYLMEVGIRLIERTVVPWRGHV
jgi:ABC-type nitrate/sulfonate/bicarbonate transport system permease component